MLDVGQQRTVWLPISVRSQCDSQAHPHEPPGLGDQGSSRLRIQERLHLLRFWIDRFKLAVRACSFFVLMSFSCSAAGRSRHWMHICALHSRQRLL